MPRDAPPKMMTDRRPGPALTVLWRIGPVEYHVENPKILIICALIIAVIAGCLSLISPKQPQPPSDELCRQLRAAPPDDDALEPFMRWDDPRYQHLCATSGGGR